MLIVLEGVDRVGKTTLASRLAKRLGCAVDHRTPKYEGHPLREYGATLDWYRPGVHDLVVDRFHWSERAYGDELRGGSELTDEGVAWVDMYLHSRGAVVVLMEDSIEGISRRLGTDDPDEAATRSLQESYIALGNRALVPVLRANLTTPRLAVRVLAAARRAEAAAARLAGFPTYVGPPRPAGLLFGIRRREGRRNHGHAAAFAPYPDSSGRHLMRCLPDSVGLANAEECDPYDLWRALGRPPAAALGKEADAILEEAGVPRGAACHPQLARRFNYRYTEEYRRLLESALAGERFFNWRMWER